MKYYLKKAILPWVYLALMTIMSLTVHAVESAVVKYFLMAVTLLLYLFIVALFAYKDGQEALKVRLSNDIERRTIIETGEDRPLNLKEEYKPYKGFVMALVASLPLIVLMVIHTLLIPSSNGLSTGASKVANVLYSIVYNFFTWKSTTVYTSYFTLLYIPIMMIAMGIPYILGAKLIEDQQSQIKDIHKQIYGE
ncbi:MAG: hypothetical protein J6R83_01930 [Clostridia bacterium]|nr:hypothetical protein [Clostridia bacterium]